MTASLQDIINKIADSADDFLAEAASRSQARAGIEELLAADYPSLAPADRTKVIAGVLSILEREGFFEGTKGDSIWDEEVAGEGD